MQYVPELPPVRSIFRAAFPLMSLLAALPAAAQDAPPPSPPPADAPDLSGDNLMIGAGAVYLPSYDGSDDMVWTAAPGARGRVSDIVFTWRGNRAWVDLVPDPVAVGWDFQVGPIVNLNFNRTGNVADAQVIALGKKKIALELGGYVGIGYQGLITSDFDKIAVSVGVVQDVTGVNRGYVITPSLDYGTPLSRFTFVGINLSANYASADYASAYFDVDAAGSARSGLPVFSAGAGWKDWNVSLAGMQSLTGDLTHGLQLVGGVSYRRMLNDSADSPLTSIAGSRDQWTGLLGLAYAF